MTGSCGDHAKIIRCFHDQTTVLIYAPGDPFDRRIAACEGDSHRAPNRSTPSCISVERLYDGLHDVQLSPHITHQGVSIDRDAECMCGRRRRERRIGQVDADADQCEVADPLDQDPAKLLLIDKNVIRPLQTRIEAEATECADDGEARTNRQDRAVVENERRAAMGSDLSYGVRPCFLPLILSLQPA